MRLPGINGFQLAEYGLDNRPAMKVVLMTGFTQDPLPQNWPRRVFACSTSLTIWKS